MTAAPKNTAKESSRKKGGTKEAGAKPQKLAPVEATPTAATPANTQEAPSTAAKAPEVKPVVVSPQSQATSMGDIFKQRRSHLQVSLDQASRILRIHVRYLQALEEGDFNVLPERVFTLGFIRSYGNYLGLDGVSLVKRYKPIFDQIRPSAMVYMPPKTADGQGSDENLFEDIPQWVYVLGGIAITCLFMWSWFELMQDEPTDTVTGPETAGLNANTQVSPAAPVAMAAPPAPVSKSVQSAQAPSNKSSLRAMSNTQPAPAKSSSPVKTVAVKKAPVKMATPSTQASVSKPMTMTAKAEAASKVSSAPSTMSASHAMDEASGEEA